jgi:hypothetical protein
MPQPCTSGSDAGKHENDTPDVVGVFFQERALVAVEIGRGTFVRWQGGILVGIRLLDLRRVRQLSGKLLADVEHLPCKGADRGVRQGARRDD